MVAQLSSKEQTWFESNARAHNTHKGVRNIKKLLVFILILIVSLSTFIYADWPGNYGTEPIVDKGLYPYRFMFLSRVDNNYYYVVSDQEWVSHKLNQGVILYDLAHTISGTPTTKGFKSTMVGGVPTWSQYPDAWFMSSINYDYELKYTSFDMYCIDSTNGNNRFLFHPNDDNVTTPITNCTIYKVGVGDTLNIQNSTTNVQSFYFKATNATYEKIVAIGANQPIVKNYTNLSSGEWEWMEPEAKANYNYWKIRQGTIEIGVPKDSPLVVKITRKVPTGGYDTIPSPDRGNYEAGIFGSISYGIDTLIYWVSYPFIAVGQLFVGLIEEIKLNLGWINDFTGLVGILFGWIPERFQGLLFIGASATAISFIIRVFRGS